MRLQLLALFGFLQLTACASNETVFSDKVTVDPITDHRQSQHCSKVLLVNQKTFQRRLLRHLWKIPKPKTSFFTRRLTLSLRFKLG